MNNKQSVLTGSHDGWQSLSSVNLDSGETTCLHCDETATEAVSIGKGLHWALCQDCEHEVKCAGYDAGFRSESEMDYFAGYD